MVATTQKQNAALDYLISNIEHLNSNEFDTFMTRVMAIRARRKANGLSKNEAELMICINRSLPENIQNRYHELDQKRRTESLTPGEQHELIEIIEQIEQHDAQRAEYLYQLSQLRNVPVKQLMTKLGIKQPTYAG